MCHKISVSLFLFFVMFFQNMPIFDSACTGESVPIISSTAVFYEFNENKNCKAESYIASNGSKLPYRLYVPSDYDPERSYPLVLFLHGAGERGIDNKAQISSGGSVMQRLLTAKEKKEHPCLILAPQCPANSQWVLSDWGIGTYDHTKIQVSPYLLAAEELADKVATEYSVDLSALYVTGISMGGYGAWDIISRNPEKFAAAVPICGGVDKSYLPALHGMPIWAFHNSGDTIVPSLGSRAAYEALKDYGNMQYTEYNSTAHDAWSAAYAEADLTDWLFSQHARTRVVYSDDVNVYFEGPSSVIKGESLSFTYSVSKGYILKRLLCGDRSVTFTDPFSGGVTLTDYKGEQLRAVCSKIFYITCHSSYCTVNLPEYIEEGQQLSFGIEPEKGYARPTVLINGQELLPEEDGTYILKNVTEDLTLEISFKENSHPYMGVIIACVIAALILIAVGAGALVFIKKKKL